MSRIRFRSGCYYHVFNRGVNRGPIFFNRGNYAFFIERLRDYFTPDLVQITAYCLMPTHYHLLVKTVTDGEFGSKVMRPFSTSYVKAINKQQQRVGTLFQGKYKAKIVGNDTYLAHLTRYIHCNPVVAGHVDLPEDWPYSSYRDYVGLRAGTIAQSGVILRQFSSAAAYSEFAESPSYQAPTLFLDWLRA